jgi:predicted ATPase
MPLRVTVNNYRCLSSADWTLDPGVSLLVGPNGSGKTTLLEVVSLLRDALEKGTRAAVDEHGGPGTIINLKADSAEKAEVAALLDDCSWQIELRPRGGEMTIAHRVLTGGKQIVEEEPPVRSLFGGNIYSVGPIIDYQPTTFASKPTFLLVEPGTSGSPELKMIADQAPEAIRPLLNTIGGYFLHGGYFIRSLRVNGSRISSDVRLDRDGTNAFSVLRNWRDARATRSRWDFVISGLKEAFPESFEEIEFETAGQTVAGRVIAPGTEKSIGTYFAPDGLLTGLLHLTAVASTPDGGALAIDEFENSLHPYAICALLDHVRSWSKSHGTSITLATHSPVLIDQFKDEPHRLLVMDPGAEVRPVPVSTMRDPEWLAHFSLGDLYARGEFGSQARH